MSKIGKLSECLKNPKVGIAHGSIVGFDGGVHFRLIKGKVMTLLNRGRNDGCGQPCIMIYEELDQDYK